MFELLLIGAAFLTGLAVGHWWALVVAPAVGVWLAYEFSFENVSPPHWEFGAAVAVLAAVSIAIGVGIRKSADRSEPQRG